MPPPPICIPISVASYQIDSGASRNIRYILFEGWKMV